MRDCNTFWAYAAHLPMNQVIQYWCERSGYNAQHCKEAKQAAIISECERGNIKYRRSDGKTFNDPVSDLAARDLLLIEKTSFDAWYSENFEGVSPLPEPPLNPRKERTYQNTIAALLAVIAGELPGTVRHPSFSGDTKMYEAIEAHFKGYDGLSASNLSRKCPEAKRSLNKQ